MALEDDFAKASNDLNYARTAREGADAFLTALAAMIEANVDDPEALRQISGMLRGSIETFTLMLINKKELG